MKRAKFVIKRIMERDKPHVVVSGRSPLGGVDTWAEEIAKEMGIDFVPFEPIQHSWDGEYGFKARNLDIARFSDKVYVIVVDDYPPDYKWRRMLRDGKPYCYHCADRNRSHVKSGGCWTGWKAMEMGKEVEWIIIPQTKTFHSALFELDTLEEEWRDVIAALND